MSDPIDYQQLMYEAMRGVMRRAIEICAEQGLPPGHYFYITFRTQAPGVELAPDLVARYPDVMTIILQHQFWNLEVDEEGFSLGLSFSARPHTLTIPFSAVISFADPPAEVGLRFVPAEELEQASAAVGEGAVSPGQGPKAVEAAAEPRQAEVVSIDAFRKR